MGDVARNIFRAVHEQKILAIEYRNKSGEDTRYWIGVKGINPERKSLDVRGMHLVKLTTMDFTIYIDRIRSSAVVDGTYFKTPPRLLRSLEEDPERYEPVFGSVANLKILDYLADCTKLGSTPRARDYTLVPRIDKDSFRSGRVTLDKEQFNTVIKALNNRARFREADGIGIRQVALNVLSIHTSQGLYVLAYREMRLDIERRAFILGRNTIFCREFLVWDGKATQVMSIRRFLDEDDFDLVDSFEVNAEEIKNRIAQHCGPHMLVDDEPHVFEITRAMPVNLEEEYGAISQAQLRGESTYPLKAFFGEMTKRPRRVKEYPLVLVDQRANLDQLMAINQAMRYPLTYVQGPPGTGKTSTIVNTLANALFNQKTVLFVSYNNHPVDGVFESLCSLRYRGKLVPFPVLRLGNQQRVRDALLYMAELYEQAKGIGSSEKALDGLMDREAGRTTKLVKLLQDYEERVELEERRECMRRLLETNKNLTFGISLEGGQLAELERRLEQAEPYEDMLVKARAYVVDDEDTLMGYFYLRSARMVRRLGEPRNADLLKIVMAAVAKAKGGDAIDAESEGETEDPALLFNRWLSDTGNLKRLLRIFPIIATTCLSAHRLGDPIPTFDLCVIDEASQCDTATSLIPIARAENLMLVGDPQQLNPVVTIDRVDNEALKRSYHVPNEYDYVENSVYKVFLACDAVSNEILLREHYRCDANIIGYNNQKYYNGQLLVRSGRHAPDALEFIDIEYDTSHRKNTAPAEADAVVRYALDHPDSSIGVITPFANQCEEIRAALEASGVTNATCGTVHSYQGDEKDVVLFSLALTDRTGIGTYKWLCDNRELINVATSRARNKLVVLSSSEQLERLHGQAWDNDDLYELVQYVREHGQVAVTPREASSRALGVKPFSTETEAAFLETLTHALGTIFMSDARHTVRREVGIAHVFGENIAQARLFYSGRFDFVVYESRRRGEEFPVLAIELDGREHLEDEVVQRRDRAKEAICEAHGFKLIRVPNGYARRYHHIKEILEAYFRGA